LRMRISPRSFLAPPASAPTRLAFFLSPPNMAIADGDPSGLVP
jgi:hypothetical protein